MLVKTYCAAVTGLEATTVMVEVSLSRGVLFHLTGLPDNAVRESHDRLVAALQNTGFKFPVADITVNMAPADLRKTGPVYDLPVLLGVLCASGQLGPLPSTSAFVGELSLDGGVRPIQGALTMAITARDNGIHHLFLPAANAAEAAVLPELKVYAIESVGQLLGHLRGDYLLSPVKPLDFDSQQISYPLDLADVHGQPEARRALEIAAAGGHNLLFIGAPGSGKSMLAKRLPSILPPLTREESMETTQIHSVAGLLQPDSGLLCTRPFRSPHHTVSSTALTGGGTVPRPGEISLAHNGVLFLDELPEFQRTALEILRQPLEDGTITISRAAGKGVFPCHIMLVAAMNPCPCGYLGDEEKECKCTEQEIHKYLKKISGPLLDRIDIQIEVKRPKYEKIMSKNKNETSLDIRKRVNNARNIQVERYKKFGIYSNAQLNSRLMAEFCVLDKRGEMLLEQAFIKLKLSVRAHERILKVARTIADLDGEKCINYKHIAEAIQYRSLDKFI